MTRGESEAPLPGLADRDPDLESSLRFLMGRFADTADPRIAAAIVYHLQLALDLAGIRRNSGLLAFYRSKVRLWRLLSDGE